MLTHIGILTLEETATNEQRQAIVDGLTALVGVVPGLQNAEVATDLGVTPGNASLIFQLTFDSTDSWRAYGAHPAHKAIITERIAPVLHSKLFLQVAGFAEAEA